MKKYLSLLSKAALLFSLTACLEFNEITQLAPDGKAQITLVIKMPEIDKEKKSSDAQNKDLEESASDLLGGLSQSFQIVKQEDKREFGISSYSLVVSLPSLAGVKDFYRNTEFKKKDGGKDEVKKGKDSFEQIFLQSEHFKVKKTKEGTLKITRAFQPPKGGLKSSSGSKDDKEKSKEMEKLSKDLEDAMLNAFYFTFEFIPPTEVKSSNAGRIVGNTYRWETTFGYLSRNPFTMEMEIADLPH